MPLVNLHFIIGTLLIRIEGLTIMVQDFTFYCIDCERQQSKSGSGETGELLVELAPAG